MPSRREILAGWVEELTVEQEEINDLLKHVIRHRARIREKLTLLQQLQQLEEDSAKAPPAPQAARKAEAPPKPEPKPKPAPVEAAAESRESNGRKLVDLLGDDPLDREIEAAARELFGQG